jgi:hypothetical protein
VEELRKMAKLLTQIKKPEETEEKLIVTLASIAGYMTKNRYLILPDKNIEACH